MKINDTLLRFNERVLLANNSPRKQPKIPVVPVLLTNLFILGILVGISFDFDGGQTQREGSQSKNHASIVFALRLEVLPNVNKNLHNLILCQ
jgi:hypothetical protein